MIEEFNEEEFNRDINEEDLNEEEIKNSGESEESPKESSEEMVGKESSEEGESDEKEWEEGESDEEGEESQEESDSEGLPFAKAEVVRLMKQKLDSDKMIRERVKVEMNRFLGEVLENVCEQLNEYPYTTIEYEMLKESIYPYKNIKRINEERIRLLKHMDAIKADCDALSMDIQRTLKLKDVDEHKDEFFQ